MRIDAGAKTNAALAPKPRLPYRRCMSFTLHPNRERGHVDHGWLKAAHSFSFARYVNPDRMQFGALLVLNEDVIAPGQGFGEHFHDNMEIVTIPLSGSLQHHDSLGNGSVIHAGEGQIMSAGTGIMHSEFNASATEPVHLLQLWILPHTRGLKTRYEQQLLPAANEAGWRVVASPQGVHGSFVIHQEAWIELADVAADKTFTKSLHDPSHGLFLFVIEGSIDGAGHSLSTGDALAVEQESSLTIETKTTSRLLALEVPLTF